MNSTATGLKAKAKKKSLAEKLAEVAQEIRDYPIIAIRGALGEGYVGEVARLKSGEWIARRYGKNYPNDYAIFPNGVQAAAFFQPAKE
ncbi:MAG TPA: hypothetical protein VJM76_05790 [Gammaproteobacteria bacterium]|nr:hypothetical protein [Gammaproteobacteria bacterium]